MQLQRGDPMTKPITDKAEIALEYPDKLYVGTFERSSVFEAHLDPTGIALILERPGADDVHKSIHMHINFGLIADIPSKIQSRRRRPRPLHARRRSSFANRARCRDTLFPDVGRQRPIRA